MDDGCAVIVVRFDSELAQALEEAENERDQKDKALQENTALGTEIYTLRRNLQVRVGNPTPPQLTNLFLHLTSLLRRFSSKTSASLHQTHPGKI